MGILELFSLEAKPAFVTGAARGVSRGIAAALASDPAPYCTGSDILIDGGYTLW